MLNWQKQTEFTSQNYINIIAVYEVQATESQDAKTEKHQLMYYYAARMI